MRYLFLIFLFGVLQQACKSDYDAPCRPIYIDSLNLSTAELAIVPYTPSDSVWMISESSDTILCTNTCWIISYQNEVKPVNPECPNDSFGYQSIQSCMNDSLSKLLIQTRLDNKQSVFQLSYTGNNVLFTFDEFAQVADSVPGAHSIMILGTDTFQNVHGKQTDMGDSVYYNSQYGILRVLSQGNNVKWRLWKR